MIQATIGVVTVIGFLVVLAAASLGLMLIDKAFAKNRQH